MPSLADFERDYWAPDREEVLARMRAEQAPAQPSYQDFEANYWAPDREQVLAQMPGAPGAFYGQGGPGGYWDRGGYYNTGITGGGNYGGGGGGSFNEAALQQAWLGSGGRTPQDLANFFQNNPQLVGGAKLVGSKKDKIQLPDGRVIDAVLAAGAGGQGAQWLVEGGGGGGGVGYSGFERAPNPTPFQYEKFARPGEFTYEDFAAPEKFTGPEWQAPTDVGEWNDPGYNARLAEGQKALERSAAARGTLLTGGTLKDLSQYAQDYAANEYQNVYNRAYQDYTTNYQRQAQEYDRSYQAAVQDYMLGRENAFGNYQTNYQNALDAYRTNFETQFQPWKEGYNQAYQSWAGNFNAANTGFQNELAKEQQRYGQLYGLADLGLRATGQQAQYGSGYAGNLGNIYSGYGQGMGDLITGAGNAAASGKVGSANAWGGLFGNLANMGTMAGLYGLMDTSKGPTAGNDWYANFLKTGGRTGGSQVNAD